MTEHALRHRLRDPDQAIRGRPGRVEPSIPAFLLARESAEREPAPALTRARNLPNTVEPYLLPIWGGLAFLWMAAAVWLLAGNLVGDCDRLLGERNFSLFAGCRLETLSRSGSEGLLASLWPLSVQIVAAEWILLPPLALLAVGYACWWMVSRQRDRRAALRPLLTPSPMEERGWAGQQPTDSASRPA
jgi:hypothetical protein